MCRIIPLVPYQGFLNHDYCQSMSLNMTNLLYVIVYIVNSTKVHQISFSGLIIIMGQKSWYGTGGMIPLLTLKYS